MRTRDFLPKDTEVLRGTAPNDYVLVVPTGTGQYFVADLEGRVIIRCGGAEAEAACASLWPDVVWQAARPTSGDLTGMRSRLAAMVFDAGIPADNSPIAYVDLRGDE